jgi:ABC-type sugar transport system substrate-binding protein
LALTAVESLLGGNQNIDGIFAQNDLMALGAARAERLGEADSWPVIIGYDAIPAARKAVTDGDLHATVSQNPHEMGRLAVSTLMSIREGRPFEARVEVPTQVITK